jgi:hypothetical protein
VASAEAVEAEQDKVPAEVVVEVLAAVVAATFWTAFPPYETAAALAAAAVVSFQAPAEVVAIPLPLVVPAIVLAEGFQVVVTT